MVLYGDHDDNVRINVKFLITAVNEEIIEEALLATI